MGRRVWKWAVACKSGVRCSARRKAWGGVRGVGVGWWRGPGAMHEDENCNRRHVSPRRLPVRQCSPSAAGGRGSRRWREECVVRAKRNEDSAPKRVQFFFCLFLSEVFCPKPSRW